MARESATTQRSSAQRRIVQLRVSNDAIFEQYKQGVRGTNIPLLYTSEPFDNSLAALRKVPDGREKCIDCFIADEVVDPNNADPSKRRLSWVAYVDSGCGMTFEAMDRWGFRGAEPVLEKKQKAGKADNTQREANKTPCLIDADLSQHGQGSHITAFLQARQMVIVTKTAGSDKVLEMAVNPDEYGQEIAELPCEERLSLEAQGKAWPDAQTLVHTVPGTEKLKQLPQLLEYWETHGSSEVHKRKGQESWTDHSFTAFIFLNLRCGRQDMADLYTITADDKAYESFYHSFNRMANEIKKLYFFQMGYAPAFGAFFGGHMHATANACHASDKGVIYEQGVRKPLPRNAKQEEMHVSFHVFALWNNKLPGLKDTVQSLRQDVDPDVEAAQGVRFVDVSKKLKKVLEGLDSVAADAPPKLLARWRHRKLNVLPYPGWPLQVPTERWHWAAEDTLSRMARVAMARVVELKQLEPTRAAALERLRTFPIALRHAQWRSNGDLPIQMMLQYFPVYRSEQSLDRVLGMRDAMPRDKAEDPEVIKMHSSMPLFPDQKHRLLFWWNGRLQGRTWGLGEKVLPMMQLDQASLRAIEKSPKYKRLLEWIPIEGRTKDVKNKEIKALVRERNKSLAKLVACRIAGHVFLQDYKRRRGESSDARKYRKERETIYADDGSMIRSGPSDQECKGKHEQTESFVATHLYDPSMYLEFFSAAGEVYDAPRFACDLEEAALREFDAQTKASDIPRSLSMARLDFVLWLLSAKDELDEEVTLHSLIDNEMLRTLNPHFTAENDKDKDKAKKFKATQPELRAELNRLYRKCEHKDRVLMAGDLVHVEKGVVKLHDVALKSTDTDVPNMPAEKKGEWGVIKCFFDQRDVGVPHVVYKSILCQKHWELAGEDGLLLDRVPDCYKLTPVSACKMYQRDEEPAGENAMKEWLMNKRSGVDAHVPKQLQIALWPADVARDGPEFPSLSDPLRDVRLPEIFVGLACGPDNAWLVSDFAGPSFKANSPGVNSLDVKGNASQKPDKFSIKCHLFHKVPPEGNWEVVTHTVLSAETAETTASDITHPCPKIPGSKAFKFTGVGSLQPQEYMIAFSVQHALLAAQPSSTTRTRTQASGMSSRTVAAAAASACEEGNVQTRWQFAEVVTGVFKAASKGSEARFIWAPTPRDDALKKLVFEIKGYTPSAVLKFKVAPGEPTSLRLTDLHLPLSEHYYLGAEEADVRPDATPTTMHTSLKPESWPQLRLSFEVIDSNGMPCVEPETVLAFVKEHIATCEFLVHFHRDCAPPRTPSDAKLPCPLHVHVATELLSAECALRDKVASLVPDTAGGEGRRVVLPAYLTPSRELLNRKGPLYAFVMSRWCPDGPSELRKDLKVEVVMKVYTATGTITSSRNALRVLPGFAASLEFDSMSDAAIEVENGSCIGASTGEAGRLSASVRALDAYGFPATLTTPDTNVGQTGRWLHGILSKSGAEVPFCMPHICVKETVTQHGVLAEVPVDTEALQTAWQLDHPRSRFKLDSDGLRLRLLSGEALKELQGNGRVPALFSASLFQAVPNVANAVTWLKLQPIPCFRPTANGHKHFEQGLPPTVSRQLVITPRSIPTEVIIRNPAATHPDPSEPRMWRIAADAGAQVTVTIELRNERGNQLSIAQTKCVVVTPSTAVMRGTPPKASSNKSSMFQLTGLIAPPSGSEPRMYGFEVWWARKVDKHGKTVKVGHMCDECNFVIELAAKPPPPTRWVLKPRQLPAAPVGQHRGAEPPMTDVRAGGAIPPLLLFREDEQGSRCTDPLDQAALPLLQARWTSADVSAQLQVKGMTDWQPPLPAGDNAAPNAPVVHTIVLSDEANIAAVSASALGAYIWEVHGIFVGGTLQPGHAGDALAHGALSAVLHLSVKSNPSSSDGLAPSSEVQIRLHPGEAKLLSASVHLPPVCHLRLPLDNSDLRAIFTDAWHNFTDPLDVTSLGNQARNAMATGAAPLTMDATLLICRGPSAQLPPRLLNSDVLHTVKSVPFIMQDPRFPHVYVLDTSRANHLKMRPDQFEPGPYCFRLMMKRTGGKLPMGSEMASELLDFEYGTGPFVSRLDLVAYVRSAGHERWTQLSQVESIAANEATELRFVVQPQDEKRAPLFSADASLAASLTERLATAASRDEGQDGELHVTLYRPSTDDASHAPVTLDYDSVRVGEGVLFRKTVDLRHVGKYKLTGTYKEPDRSIRLSMVRELAVNCTVTLDVAPGHAAQLRLKPIDANEQHPRKLCNMSDAVDNVLLVDVRALDAFGNGLPVWKLRPQRGGQGLGRYPVDPTCLQIELVPSEDSQPTPDAQPVHTEALYKANQPSGAVRISIQPQAGSGVGQQDGGRMDLVVKHFLPVSANGEVQTIQSRLRGIVIWEDLQSRSEVQRQQAMQLLLEKRAADLEEYTVKLQHLTTRAGAMANDLSRMTLNLERVSQDHCKRFVRLLQDRQLQPFVLSLFGNSALDLDLSYQDLSELARQHNHRFGSLEHCLIQEFDRQQRLGATLFGRRMTEMRNDIMRANADVFGMAGDLLAFNDASVAEVVQCSARFDAQPLTADDVRAVITNYLRNKLRYTFSRTTDAQSDVVELCKARRYQAASTQLSSCSSPSQVEAYSSRPLNFRAQHFRIPQQLNNTAAKYFSLSELIKESDYFYERCEHFQLERHNQQACAVGIVSKVAGKMVLHIGDSKAAIYDRRTLLRDAGADVKQFLNSRDLYTLKDSLRFEPDGMCHIDGGRAQKESKDLKDRLAQNNLGDWDVKLGCTSKVSEQVKQDLLRHCIAASYSAQLHAKADEELTTARRASEDEAPRLTEMLEDQSVNMAHLKDTVDRALQGLLSHDKYARWTQHLNAWSAAVQDRNVAPWDLALTADSDTPHHPHYRQQQHQHHHHHQQHPQQQGLVPRGQRFAPNVPGAAHGGAGAAGGRAAGDGARGQSNAMQRLAAQAQQSQQQRRGRGAPPPGPPPKRHRPGS